MTSNEPEPKGIPDDVHTVHEMVVDALKRTGRPLSKSLTSEHPVQGKPAEWHVLAEGDASTKYTSLLFVRRTNSEWTMRWFKTGLRGSTPLHKFSAAQVFIDAFYDGQSF